MVYAADIALVVEDRLILMRVLETWEDVLRREGLKIKRGETKVMNIERVKEDLSILLHGEIIKCVTKFEFLDVTVSSVGEMLAETEERIVKFSEKQTRPKKI